MDHLTVSHGWSRGTPRVVHGWSRGGTGTGGYPGWVPGWVVSIPIFHERQLLRTCFWTFSSVGYTRIPRCRTSSMRAHSPVTPRPLERESTTATIVACEHHDVRWRTSPNNDVVYGRVPRPGKPVRHRVQP